MTSRNKKTRAQRRVKAGTTEVVDPRTGELKTVPHYEIKDVDINWNKVWLGHLLDCLDLVGNKKIKIINWLLENRNPKNNEIVATQSIIADELQISKQTVTDTFKALQQNEVLLKKRNGVYTLSPDFIWEGNGDNRMDILLTYEDMKGNEKNKED